MAFPDARGKDFPSLGALRPQAEGKPSLGDPAVVQGVLTDMLAAIREEPSSDAAVAAVHKATAILAGQDDAFGSMGPWNEGEGLGNWIRGHMAGVPADGGTEAAAQYALAHLVLHQADLIRMVNEGRLEAPEAAAHLRVFVQKWTRLFLGIPGGLAEPADLFSGPRPA